MAGCKETSHTECDTRIFYKPPKTNVKVNILSPTFKPVTAIICNVIFVIRSVKPFQLHVASLIKCNTDTH